jgi:hypothetical protein
MFRACIASGTENSPSCLAVKGIVNAGSAPTQTLASGPAAAVVTTTVQVLNGTFQPLQLLSVLTPADTLTFSKMSRVMSRNDVRSTVLTVGTAAIPLEMLYQQFQMNPYDGVKLRGFDGYFFPIYQCIGSEGGCDIFGPLFESTLGILYAMPHQGPVLSNPAVPYPVTFNGSIFGSDSFRIISSSAESPFPCFSSMSDIWGRSLHFYTWLDNKKVFSDYECTPAPSAAPR